MVKPVENKTVLCFDPDESSRQFLSGFLAENFFDPICVDRSAEAIQALVEKEPAIVIMEMHLEDVSALEFINIIRRITPSAVLLIYTSQNDRRKGSDRRLGNVFEYVEKDARKEILLSHLTRAYSFYCEKKSTIFYQTDHEDRMRYQLEWLLWKQKTRIEEKMRFTGQIIDNIKHSISQGMGAGSIITLMDLMDMKKEVIEDGSRYIVHASLVDSLVASSQLLHKWLQGLDRVGQEFSRVHKEEILSSRKTEEVIETVIQDLSETCKIKNQSMILDQKKIAHSVIGNADVLDITLRELLSNAFKYSPENSEIHILRYRSGNAYAIAVINDIMRMDGGVTGLPEGNENEIFEPFFRLNNIFDERFQEGRSGLGLGLTLIQKAIHQTGGQLFIREVVDHLSRERRKRIIAEIILPVGASEEAQSKSATGEKHDQTNSREKVYEAARG